MRFWVLVVLVWPAASGAETLGPLEQPPEDFAGAQYIDSAGCVYLRQGSVWAPRLDRDGTVICGYPPSLPGLAGHSGEAQEDPALRLSMTLAEGLRDADVLADPPDLLKREHVNTPRPRSGPLADLDGALRDVAALRAASAEQQGRVSPLCDLLGYDGPSGTARGAERALGFCSGGAPDLPPKSAALGQVKTAENAGPAETGEAERSSAVARAEPVGAPGSMQDRSGKAAAKADSPGSPTAAAVVPGKTATATRTTTTDPEMIPAGARYVMIGRFPVPAEAEAAMLRLVRLGYPVAQGRKPDAEAGGRLVLVGPFRERQALVSALNQLRRGGYPKAVAR